MSVVKSNQSFNSSMELPYALPLVLNAAENKELDFVRFYISAKTRNSQTIFNKKPQNTARSCITFVLSNQNPLK
jgi:hypothetical protein